MVKVLIWIFHTWRKLYGEVMIILFNTLKRRAYSPPLSEKWNRNISNKLSTLKKKTSKISKGFFDALEELADVEIVELRLGYCFSKRMFHKGPQGNEWEHDVVACSNLIY